MSAESELAPNVPLSNRVQKTLVHAYKGFGVMALVGILIGLGCFLIVNAFYLVNDSWIRPVILTPAHDEVVARSATLSTELRNREQIRTSQAEIRLELATLAAAEAEHERFQKDLETVSTGSTYEAVMARRKHAVSVLELSADRDRKKTLIERLGSLESAEESADAIIARLQDSPYHRATSGRVTVAFVPYDNLENVTPSAPIYGCRWGLIVCSEVGHIGARLEGEVSDHHPHSGKAVRGLMVELELNEEWAAEESALFVGSKPFWLL